MIREERRWILESGNDRVFVTPEHDEERGPCVRVTSQEGALDSEGGEMDGYEQAVIVLPIEEVGSLVDALRNAASSAQGAKR